MKYNYLIEYSTSNDPSNPRKGYTTLKDLDEAMAFIKGKMDESYGKVIIPISMTAIAILDPEIFEPE